MQDESNNVFRVLLAAHSLFLSPAVSSYTPHLRFNRGRRQGSIRFILDPPYHLTVERSLTCPPICRRPRRVKDCIEFEATKRLHSTVRTRLDEKHIPGTGYLSLKPRRVRLQSAHSNSEHISAVEQWPLWGTLGNAIFFSNVLTVIRKAFARPAGLVNCIGTTIHLSLNTLRSSCGNNNKNAWSTIKPFIS